MQHSHKRRFHLAKIVNRKEEDVHRRHIHELFFLEEIHLRVEHSHTGHNDCWPRGIGQLHHPASVVNEPKQQLIALRNSQSWHKIRIRCNVLRTDFVIPIYVPPDSIMVWQTVMGHSARQLYFTNTSMKICILKVSPKGLTVSPSQWAINTCACLETTFTNRKRKLSHQTIGVSKVVPPERPQLLLPTHVLYQEKFKEALILLNA